MRFRAKKGPTEAIGPFGSRLSHTERKSFLFSLEVPTHGCRIRKRVVKGGPADPNSPPGTQGSGAEASDDSGQPTGKAFSAKQMEGLYKKAFTLRIGMSPDEVFSIMGPPTKREVFSPAEHTLPGNPAVDSRIQDTATWSSSEDPGSAYVMVNFMDGSGHDIIANKKGGKVLSLAASR